jgi:tetratricopeptide (TPR) repeat protein
MAKRLHPVFFSFAGDTKELAERLKAKFADDLVYCYSRTGVDGDSFPVEILSEIRQCELFVMFWSAAYVAADPRRPWCRRELLTAVRRLASGNLHRVLLLQCDGTPLTATITDPDTGEVIDVLKIVRDETRAFSHPFSSRAVEERLGHELAQLGEVDHPILPRSDYQEQLRETLASTGRSKTPVVFVNGYHGSGRRTLVKTVMEVDFRHLTPYTLGLDSADGPEDLLRLVWGDVLQKSVAEQRLMMRDVKEHPAALSRYFAQLGTQLAGLRAYLILSNDDPIDVGEVVPHWVVEMLSQLRPTVQPLAFLIVGRGLPNYMQRLIPDGGEVAVPSLEDSEATELARMLVGAIDPLRAERWEPHIAAIVGAGGNNAKLLVDIIKVASRRASLDFLAQDAAVQVQRFDERLQRVLEWGWAEISEDTGIVQLLDVLNLLGSTDIAALEDIFEHDKARVGEWLYRLTQVGLVEALSESVYRVPRALARRLNTFLAGAASRTRSHELLKRFARSVDVGADEHGGVILTNRLQAKLATDTEIDEEDIVFVTTAMLFRSGWQRYRLGQYSSALKLLRRAFGGIDRVRDDSTKLEICRYYGLCAGREHSDHDVDAACAYLAQSQHFHHRFGDKVRAMELFIRAFALKSDSQFALALPRYEEAIALLPEGAADIQRSQMMNEMIQCLLRIEPVDYKRAKDLGVRLCALRETPNNIDAFLRALLGETYYSPGVGKKVVRENLSQMNQWEARLKAKCESSNLSFYTHRVIDRKEADAIEAVLAVGADFPALDLTAAIALAREAYGRYRDESLVWRRWDLMLLTELGRDWVKLHQEAHEYLVRSAPNRMARGNAARVKILTFDLSDEVERRTAFAELEKYRNDRTLPRSVAQDIKRQLDSGDQRHKRVLDKMIRRGLRPYED